MSYVFVSYSHRDVEFVRTLVDDLQKNGVSVWVDFLNIRPGEDWQDSTDQALKQAGTLLFIASANAILRTYIVAEVSTARVNQVPVIPVVIDDDGAKKMPRVIQNVTPLDFRADYAGALAELLTRLPADLRQRAAVTPAEPKSRGYVFISYAQEDSEFVGKLRQFLQDRGYAYWDYQDSDRDYHSQLALELEDVIRGAKATLSILSPDWKLSKWAAKEFMFSEEVGTPVFLLMAREMGPTLVTAGIPYIDFTHDESAGYAKLDRELRRKGLIE